MSKASSFRAMLAASATGFLVIGLSVAQAGGPHGHGGVYAPGAQSGGSHVQDHRGGQNLGGTASAGGPKIKCVVFCGNSFTPSGSNHAQDHRTGGTPIVNGNGQQVGSGPAGSSPSGPIATGPRVPIIGARGQQTGPSYGGGGTGHTHVQDHR